MRRTGLFLALWLSLGINCGLLGMGILRHRTPAGGERDATADRREPSPGRQGHRLADRLGLDGAERERFLALQRQLAERVHSGRRRIDAARRELRRELVAPREPERARVEGLVLEIGREQDALDRALVENVLAVRELLDGDREREYLRFVERFGGRFADGRPPGAPGFDGPAGGLRPRFGDRRSGAGGPP